MKQAYTGKTVRRAKVGFVPTDKTRVRKGRVGSGWHKSPKSAMQLHSEKMARNS